MASSPQQLSYLNDPTIEPIDTATMSTPPTLTLPYGQLPTPLMLPREWPDDFYYASPHLDFQSNCIDLAGAGTEAASSMSPTLAGLGIKNINLDEPDKYTLDEHSQHGYSGVYERRSASRVRRIDAIYNVENNPDDTSAFLAHFPSAEKSPWSLATFLETAEFEPQPLSDESALFDSSLDTSLDASLDLDDFALESQTSGSSDDNLALSFEKLSAATGMSIAEFAEQISATAEATLKQMSALNKASSPPASAESLESMKREVSNWPPLAISTPDAELPLADINMRNSEVSWISGVVGVNPAEILPNTPLLMSSSDSEAGHIIVAPIDPVRTPAYHSAQLAPEPLHTPSLEYELQYPTFPPGLPVSLTERYVFPVPIPSPSLPLSLRTPVIEQHEADCNPPSDDDERSLFQSPSCSEYSPPLPPVGTKRTRIGTRRTAKHPDPPPAEEADAGGFDFPDDLTPEQLADLPPISLGTPVFDAHRGVDLEELKGKAERYRLRNQGRDYGKRWLISFAGKLSHRGELLEEFRCYVAGCMQVNKRRDHILIHVGAHLDQRPFKCMHWYVLLSLDLVCLTTTRISRSSSRFLRKNECKRHELSHTGVRPFSCHICPPPSTTFVRQDLLQRHMKRTHRIDRKFDKENDDRQRPKKRAKH